MKPLLLILILSFASMSQAAAMIEDCNPPVSGPIGCADNPSDQSGSTPLSQRNYRDQNGTRWKMSFDGDLIVNSSWVKMQTSVLSGTVYFQEILNNGTTVFTGVLEATAPLYRVREGCTVVIGDESLCWDVVRYCQVPLRGHFTVTADKKVHLLMQRHSQRGPGQSCSEIRAEGNYAYHFRQL